MTEKNKTGLNGQGSGQKYCGLNRVYRFIDKHALIIIGPFVLSPIMIVLLTNIPLNLAITISIVTGSYYGFFIGRYYLKTF